MNCYLTPAEKTAGKEFFCACNNTASIHNVGLAEERFHLAVLGQFKQGKSALSGASRKRRRCRNAP